MKYDYYFHKNLYSLDECQSIKELIEQNVNPNIKDLNAGGVIKTADVKSFSLGSTRDKLANFHDAITSINRNIFGFTIFETCNHEYLNFNKYSEYAAGEYSWHGDKVLNEPYDLKLTAIINISTEPFEGGDFELFLNGITPIPELREPGTLLVFPAYIQHRVTPVTKGQRITVSRWLSGPTFK